MLGNDSMVAKGANPGAAKVSEGSCWHAPDPTQLLLSLQHSGATWADRRRLSTRETLSGVRAVQKHYGFYLNNRPIFKYIYILQIKWSFEVKHLTTVLVYCLYCGIVMLYQ
uniref:Uncharacterized protein n=1 Tax=Sphaerodactylus townsendi TaxID=933632 RepID=A0ACB8ECG2_9SAUR